jgi:hypothetical protein
MGKYVPTGRPTGRPRKSHVPGRKSPVKAPVSAPTVGDSDALLTMLEGLASDGSAPARDRMVAARTILELRGQLGKHQRAPGDDLARRPLAGMTRPELEQELERLRQHFAARRPKIIETFEDLIW